MNQGIYIHIPFCVKKCFYCDFASAAGTSAEMEAYIEALCREIAAVGQRQLRAETVYIGGGTPTSLPLFLLERLLRAVQQEFLLTGNVEYTVEANPGTVDMAKLSLLRQYGVNRISLGVQSFQNHLLRRCGRIHTAEDALKALTEIAAAGFENCSLDLIYGLPGQSLDDLKESLELALSQKIRHISVYGLQVEEGTVFFAQREAGKLILPEEDAAEEMYEYLCRVLPEHGYQRYEISNFAIPGFESRHNLRYWQNLPYIGLGAAAHSYDGNCRRENYADRSAYIEAVQACGRALSAEHVLTTAEKMEEFCFLALRTREGISARAFATLFGCTLESVYGEKISRLQQQGLLDKMEQQVFLTRDGMKFGNRVFMEFLLDE